MESRYKKLLYKLLRKKLLYELLTKTKSIKHHLDNTFGYHNTLFHDCSNSVQVMSQDNGYESFDCRCKIINLEGEWDIDPYGITIKFNPNYYDLVHL